ncbi:MAG TPA: AsmA family protein [Candidatus Polarisedimenticolaceae bacterium]|nr:AsmA family protein [Candidatus Polarisedimenticolaceae bacterium]
MRRSTKITLLILGIPVALLVVAAIALPFLVDAESLRPRAEAELSRRLGRKVTLGKASVSIWSGIALKADTLSIGEPLAGPAAGVPMLSAGPTAVRVALLPLFRKEVQARSIKVEGAKVTQDGQALLSDLEVDSALKFAPDGSLETGGKLQGAVDALAGRPPLDATFAATLAQGTLEFPKLDAKIGTMEVGATGKVEGLTSPAPHAAMDVRLALPKSSVKGPVELTLDPKTPRVTFDLAASVLDVDEVTAVAATGTLAERSALSLVPEAHAEDAAGGTWLSTLSGAGKVHADRVRVSGMELTDGSANVAIDGGRVRISDTSIAAFGGKARGAAQLALFEAERPFTLAQKAEGVSLGGLVASLAPAQKGTVDGTASLDVDVKGRAGAPALLPTIDGKGFLEVTGGKLKSVGLIPQVMRLLEAAGAKGVAKDETPFDRLSAHFDVVKGVARTNDLQFRSADLDLDGGGTIAEKGKLALDVTASFSKPVTDQLVAKTGTLSVLVGPDGRLTIPLQVGGTLSAPAVHLDVDKVINEGLKKKIAKEGKKKLLEKLFGH